MAGMVARKVADLTIDEFKLLIHETIAEDIETWKESFEIMADKRLLRKIKKADADWQAGKKDAYVSWDEIKK